MKLYAIPLCVLLALSTVVGALVSSRVNDMIEYNKTMPDGSVLTYELHKRAKFSPIIEKRDNSEDVPLNATSLPSTVFPNATTISSNGSTPGPEELFQMIWTDKHWNWTEVNYCGWNAPWSTLTRGPCE